MQQAHLDQVFAKTCQIKKILNEQQINLGKKLISALTKKTRTKGVDPATQIKFNSNHCNCSHQWWQWPTPGSAQWCQRFTGQKMVSSEISLLKLGKLAASSTADPLTMMACWNKSWLFWLLVRWLVSRSNFKCLILVGSKCKSPCSFDWDSWKWTWERKIK